MTSGLDPTAVIAGLKKAISQAKLDGDELLVRKLTASLHHQLELGGEITNAPPPAAQETPMPKASRRILTVDPARHRNKFHEEHNLAAVLDSQKPPPPDSASPPERLAYWQQQREDAQAWATAFALRADGVWNPAYQALKEADLKDSQDWAAHKIRASHEIRRIRDELRNKTGDRHRRH